MKVGEYKVKRKYGWLQILLDVISVGLIVLTVVQYISFSDTYLPIASRLSDPDMLTKFYFQWALLFIWAAVDAAIVVVSVVMTQKSLKLPKKFAIGEENAAAYHEAFSNAVRELRIPALMLIFELLCTHADLVAYQGFNLQYATVILCILLGIVIVRFAVRKMRLIETKKEESSHEIIEG